MLCREVLFVFCVLLFFFFFSLIVLGKMKVCLFSLGYVTERLHRKPADGLRFEKGRFSLPLIRSKVIHAVFTKQARRVKN